MRSIFAWAILAATLCTLLAGPAAGVDHVAGFNKARRGLQQQLRSKHTVDRIEAVKRLQTFPIAESVKLLEGALDDPDDEVHQATYAAMMQMSGNLEVCTTLLTSARKSLSRADDVPRAAVLLGVVLTSDLPSVKRDADEFLDKASTSSGAAFSVALADELGAHGSALDVPPMLRLAKTSAFTDHYGVRRAVVHALSRIEHRDAVGGLIEVMPKVEGEARADAAEYLAQVTGQIFGLDAEAWGRWWEQSGEEFKFQPLKSPKPYRSVLTTASGYYYGMPLFAERLVFVLDTSGSMNGPRIEAAKRELIRAISGLPGHVKFGIVVFNSSATAWHKELVQATAESKKAAVAYVAHQDTRANTASYDALDLAFVFDTEAIYFLSDGAPNGGKIGAPADIVAAVCQANKTRRISVYTIGIGAGFPGSPLDVFLRTLAERNFGSYRRIDE